MKHKLCRNKGIVVLFQDLLDISKKGREDEGPKKNQVRGS